MSTSINPFLGYLSNWQPPPPPPKPSKRATTPEPTKTERKKPPATSAPQHPAPKKSNSGGPTAKPAGTNKNAEPPADHTYLDTKLNTAKKATHEAETSKKKLDKNKFQDNSTTLQNYKTAVSTAKEERSKAELTIQDMLNGVYRGDKSNLAATNKRAHEIAARYAGNPQAQTLVTKALHAVTTETPQQRNLNAKLLAVNKAADSLDNLIGQEKSHNNASNQTVAAANRNLQQRRTALLAAVQQQLAAQTQNGTRSSAFKNANKGIVKLSPDNSELSASVQAADVLLSVKAAAPKGIQAQLNQLAHLTPKSLDPRSRALISADPGIKKLKTAYVTQSADAVAKAYHQSGTLAAAAKLRTVTDSTDKTFVSPEIAARIINKLLPTTLHSIVVDVHTGNIQGKPDSAPVVDRSTYARITTDVSAAVESAARGSDAAAHRFDSAAIKNAIEGTGRLLALHPALWGYHGSTQVGHDNGVTLDAQNLAFPETTWDFRSSAAHGYCTLGAETVYQTTLAKQDQLPVFHNKRSGVTDRYDKQHAEHTMLATLAKGLNDQAQQSKKLEQKVLTDERPFLKPGAAIAPGITPTLYNKGEQAIKSHNPELVATLKQDLKQLDRMGLSITRSTLTLKGYESLLHGVDGWSDVAKGRTDLMSNKQALAMVGQSHSGQTYLAEQALRTAAARSDATIPSPNAYSPAAWLAINAEYLLSRRGGPIPDSLKGAHVGSIPWAGPLLLLGSGGLQTAFATTLSNASVSPKWVKGFYEVGMWGFALKRLITFGMSMGRMQPNWFNKVKMTDSMRGKVNDWLTLEPGSLRDKVTSWAARDTGLIKALVPGLMATWLTTDISGTIDSAAHGNWGGVTSGGMFVAADGITSYYAARDLISLIRARVGFQAGESLASAAAGEAATSLAAEGASNSVDAIPGVGWGMLAANLLYLGGSMFGHLQQVYDNNISNTKYFREFFSGIGLSPDKAETLAAQDGFNGKARSAGLILAYKAEGGDPAKFVHYLNSMTKDQLSTLMTAAGGVADHADGNGNVPKTQKDAKYLSLPINPEAAGAKNPHIVYNNKTKRWEAPDLHMYYSKNAGTYNQGGWVYDGPSHGMSTPRSYTATPWGGMLTTKGPIHVIASSVTRLQPISKSGLENWMAAHGYPMPPQAPKTPNPKHNQANPPARTPSLPSKPHVHIVKQGDTLWGLADNDPKVVKELYDSNPWLNPKLDDGNLATRRRHQPGRDPDLLKPGDLIVEPPGVQLPNK